MRMTRTVARLLALATLAVAGTASAEALVERMALGDLVGNADKVFRGTVVAKEPGEVEAGGATFPTVIYTLSVDDPIKGDYGSGVEAKTVTIQMLGSLKNAPQTGDVRKLFMLDINPDLDVGQTYVLFTSQPSAVGLSTTVGLGQGLFRIFNSAQGRDLAANALNNGGLFDGPVAYEELVSAIKSELQ